MTDVEKLRAWLDDSDHHCSACNPMGMEVCSGPQHLISICQILLDACEYTAAYHEGDVVTSSFDCPGYAEKARKAIADALKIVEG